MPRGGISGSCCFFVQVFQSTSNHFSQQLHFTFESAVYEGSNFSLPTLVIFYFLFFYSSHPSGCKVLSYCGFDLHFRALFLK